MSTNSFFDMNRFNYIMVRQLAVNYKTMLIGTGAIVGFLLFVGTLTILFGHRDMNQTTILGLIMPFFFAGGYIFTSVIFAELNSSNRGYLYLTLPASAFEKLLAAWLVSSVLYVVMSIVLLYFINIFYITVGTTFTQNTVAFVNVFSPGILKIFAVYLVTQSVFFLGAIYFRRVNFLKTLLALFGVACAISMYSGLLTKLIFLTPTIGNYFYINNIDPKHTPEIKYIAENVIVPTAKILFWCCTAPFFLTVSYFRLKEREV